MASEGVLMDVEAETSLVSVSDDNLLEKLSEGYAAFLTIEADKERHAFNDAVEDILNQLDDFLGTSDMVRSDISLSLSTNLNQIYMKSKEIEKQFERIDRLEAFVMMVKHNVSKMEAAVEKAESDVGTIGSLKKALSSFSIPFLSTLKSPPPPAAAAAPMPKFESWPIYRTEDYFPRLSSTSDGILRTSETSCSSQNNEQFKIPQAAATENASHQEHLISAAADIDQARQLEGNCASSSACSEEIETLQENPSSMKDCGVSAFTRAPSAGATADLSATQEFPKSDANQDS